MANPIFRLFSRHAEVDTRTGDVAERPFWCYGSCVRALQRHLSEQLESPVAARKTTHRPYGRRSSAPELSHGLEPCPAAISSCPRPTNWRNSTILVATGSAPVNRRAKF